MQFKVPQFIELEDKIVGPLTLKQFLFILAGVGLLFVLWFFLNLSAFILAAIPVGAVCLALAFYRPYGRPLISLLGAFVNYLSKPRLYLWRKNKK
ncbi:MAG: PrgI family protein [Patescibacteria group bacterium]